MINKDVSEMSKEIESGQTAIGIELGSTRIKAVLIGADKASIAVGAHDWENTLQDGVWTYSLDEVWSGIQSCMADLLSAVQVQYGVRLRRTQSIGVSAMMHGYLVFDEAGEQLVPFRTWRNNMQGPASEELTKLFDYSIPQRWSIAHLYQAILNEEAHVEQIAHATTLAGYVHWKLTGRKAMGVGEASGMFPINIGSQQFNAKFAKQFDACVEGKGLSQNLLSLLPEVLTAGERAGELTEAGARLLDPTGNLEAGIPMCPPEGDAGTGMVATNSVAVRTGNVSAGTSVFAMIVLEKELSKAHSEIDLVTTPDGKLVGMAHSNNCTSDNNAWMGVFGEVAQALGIEISTTDLFTNLLPLALKGDADCGGLLSYGYVSGEHITGFTEGRPLFVRSSACNFTLANFVRAHLFTALCALRTGLDVLFEEEQVQLDELRGHGGFFKTPEVGERIMAAATHTPVSTLANAGEGGAWGMALLAAYMTREDKDQSLPEFLSPVFAESAGVPVQPVAEDVAGFEAYFKRYQQGLVIERAAVDSLS
jgi:sugar (pentulose or hexulose) kinase